MSSSPDLTLCIMPAEVTPLEGASMRIFAYQSAENGTRLFDLDDHMCKIGLWETHLSEVIRARLCVCAVSYTHLRAHET